MHLPPLTDVQLSVLVRSLRTPASASHKGQNGKLLLVGGSELFHAASRWSLDVAAHIVDMVFYSSVPSNNELIREAKGAFWNGIVISRNDMVEYAKEADCILIGPGMTRTRETTEIAQSLVKSFPDKKWVIDAGALQMIDPVLFSANMIVTPHHQEMERILGKIPSETQFDPSSATADQCRAWAAAHGGVTVVLKGEHDLIFSPKHVVAIPGGSPGMTKGGTGDVLAGLIAALACTNELWTAAVIGAVVNKRAGEQLAETFGPFFSSSELVTQVPKTLAELIKSTEL